MLNSYRKVSGQNSLISESKSVIALKILFFTILIGTLLDFWKYGPYITPDTIGYFKMIEGNYEALGVLSPFYSYMLSLPPFTFLSVFDSATVSAIAMFLLAILFNFKFYKQIKFQNKGLFYALGCSLLSWWSFRILGRAHADSHFYILLLFWLYLFIWKKASDKRNIILISLLSAIMVWSKLNTLFLVPLLAGWIILSKEKQWAIVIGAILSSWAVYQLVLPENILQIHLSNQIVLEMTPTNPFKLFYENLATWAQVSLGLIFSDFITQYIPMTIAFTLGCLGFILLSYYIVRFRHNFREPIYKLILISLIYSAFFLGFQQWIGYKEINFRTLFPHLLVLSMALWLFLIQTRKVVALITIAILITGHTLLGHYLIWQRDDVSSLFAAKNFHYSKKKQTIDKLLIGNRQQIYTDAPEKIMLSFLNNDVLQIAPKTRFLEGKNYQLSEKESILERKKSVEALINGAAIIVLFHSMEINGISNNPAVRILKENGLVIYYLASSSQ
ncbi:hypothetical protein Q4534_18740 [Cyclobacterium sp. 1_MG-2023]|uniref:hypothetical protein n=1 Tax=Cyclobacterium sp. 1_MG-2023 TaxID=3062681 RepID=UPI0026E2E553|nr:hypothetical protein [Cyclobacterium sp. 1_MG-2023]MDO6439469.1 hypothetical protein [Cyclobacterium sp. 1_MG-2023]